MHICIREIAFLVGCDDLLNIHFSALSDAIRATILNTVLAETKAGREIYF